MTNLLQPTSFILWQAVTSATPLVLAGYGELLAQRSGVINVGIEGVMLMGAVAAFSAATLTGSAGAGLLAAAAIGLVFAALFALVTIWCRADQVVAGTAINILAAGASATASMLFRNIPSTHSIPHFFQLHLPFLTRIPLLRSLLLQPYLDRLNLPILSNIPYLGRVLANQYTLTYAVALLGVALWAILRFTRLGLIITALGDAPDAAAAAGIRVCAWRTAIVLFAGLCAALAGSFLSIMALHDFNLNMTDGRGFLVLALVIFGRWSLPGLVLGTLIFGALDGLQVYLAGIPGATVTIPHALFSALPYIATLAALAILTRASAGPLYLGRPWPVNDH